MVELVGLTGQEQRVIAGLVARLGEDDYTFAELARVEKREMPGYNGLVVPTVAKCGRRLSMTMYLATCNPFTVAHELAHVSDISTRREDTLANLSRAMPTEWHLAHRMSSEYYANRVACGYAEESDVFAAFQNDANGLKLASLQNDWASFLIHYSLLLGLFHGMDRPDCEPLNLLSSIAHLPEAVRRGIERFKPEAAHFFAGYHDQVPQALAA